MKKPINHPPDLDNPHYVYVAGPLTGGESWLKVRAAIEMSAKLMEAGFYTYVPHLSMLADMVHPLHYEAWMALDMAWIDRCDALVWLEGESAGTKREVEYATERGMYVVHEMDVDEFIKQHSPNNALRTNVLTFKSGGPCSGYPPRLTDHTILG